MIRKSKGGAPGEPILAAGAILRGHGSNAGMIAVVRRRRYGGDVSLPKGKIKRGEDVRSAALREVQEETGCEAEIVGFGGTTHYNVNGRPKAVTYFIMDASSAPPSGALDSEEIAAVEWVP